MSVKCCGKNKADCETHYRVCPCSNSFGKCGAGCLLCDGTATTPVAFAQAGRCPKCWPHTVRQAARPTAPIPMQVSA